MIIKKSEEKRTVEKFLKRVKRASMKTPHY